MPGFYDYILNRKFSGPFLGTLFTLGIYLRDRYFEIKSALGMFIFPVKRNFKIDARSIQKIIIIKTERVGDIVLSTPSLNALRTAFPNARIDFLVPVQYAKLLNCYQGWDTIITINNVLDNNEIAAAGNKLSFVKYDVAIVQHRSAYAYKLGFLSKAPIRIGWNAKGYGYLLTHPKHDDRATTHHHQVINNIRLLEPLGIVNSKPFFPVTYTDAGNNQVEAFFTKHSISKTKPIVIIHPASYSPRKQWYPERFAAIADRCNRSGMQTILIGNGKDKIVLDTVCSTMQTAPINALDTFDLEGLVSLMHSSTLFIGNFTGPMHIAASVNTNTLAIFGDRYKMDRLELWRPYTEKGVTVLTECRRANCIAQTCPKMICFDNITVDMVWNKIVSIIAATE